MLSIPFLDSRLFSLSVSERAIHLKTANQFIVLQNEPELIEWILQELVGRMDFTWFLGRRELAHILSAVRIRALLRVYSQAAASIQ